MLTKIVDNGPVPQYRNSLYWFCQDLRAHDNGALVAAAESSRRLLCVYCVDQRWFAGNNFVDRRLGDQRWRFLHQSLVALDTQLQLRGQKLRVFYGDPVQIVADLIATCDIDAVYRSAQGASDETAQWDALVSRFPYLTFRQYDTQTLFDRVQLPFPPGELPDSFSQFRRRVETMPVAPPVSAPSRLPLPVALQTTEPTLPAVDGAAPILFHGGEAAGLAHLHEYFSSDHPSRYLATRNELDGFHQSTKFSPWLANGSLSPRLIQRELAGFESRMGARESTHWIFVELLWREYFFWYALRHGHRLFTFSGIRRRKPLTSFYGRRFIQWSMGQTPWPLVNACMHQLNVTGYLSNRGRQIVASCLVNELEVDWRAGAYYFEKQLIDYDPACNWGNWQYIAGVGADPRGGRHFCIAKQTRLYDPEGVFTRKWRGDQDCYPIDAVDAVDWPIAPNPVSG